MTWPDLGAGNLFAKSPTTNRRAGLSRREREKWHSEIGKIRGADGRAKSGNAGGAWVSTKIESARATAVATRMTTRTGATTRTSSGVARFPAIRTARSAANLRD